MPTDPSTPGDLRARLWRGGSLIAIFMATLFVGNFFIPDNHAVSRKMLGIDFFAFYYGGNCVRAGQANLLYDLDSTRRFEFLAASQAGREFGPAFAPWWNPPFAAWIFVPLSALPYTSALATWWIFGGICLAISMWLLCRMLSGGWKTQLLVPMLMLTSLPLFQAFSHAQNTFLSLILLTITVVLWRGGRGFAAGMVCGLLLYKPQLGAVVALVLCLCEGRRALIGFTLAALGLAMINVLTLPGTLHDFVYRMPVNLRYMQELHGYNWGRHITFKTFWRLLVQGSAAGPMAPLATGLWLACETALAAGLGIMLYKSWNQRKSPSQRDRIIAAAIASMPLLMPFYFDYDLLLVGIAIVVYAADRQRNPASQWEDRWLIRALVTMFLASDLSSLAFRDSRVQFVVVLLAVAAALLVRRALRPQSLAANISPLPAAMAA